MDYSQKVSIILPTYNRADLIGSAIESVINQTYSNWELIVWDDGSTDNTRQVGESYKDDRIRYFWDKNHGAAYARNRAADIARGQYLAFLDSDDQWLPSMLDIQVSILEKYGNIDVLFANYRNITRDKNRPSVFKLYQNILSMMDVELLENDTFLIKNGFLEALIKENFIATDTIVLRKARFDATGGFNENLISGEDFELWLRFGLSCYQYAFTNEVLLHRVKPFASLSSASLTRCKMRFQTLNACTEQVIAHNRTDLLPAIDKLHLNTWQNMIRLAGFAGNKKLALNAFIKSLQYGFSMGSLRLLITALLSQNHTDDDQ